MVKMSNIERRRVVIQSGFNYLFNEPYFSIEQAPTYGARPSELNETSLLGIAVTLILQAKVCYHSDEQPVLGPVQHYASTIQPGFRPGICPVGRPNGAGPFSKFIPPLRDLKVTRSLSCTGYRQA